MSPSKSLESVFIDVEIAEPAASDVDLSKKLEEVCPVSIFRATDSGTEIVSGQLDECVLCDLCVEAAPAGAVTIIKKYEQ
jgi:NAD-dependent dihydropyrimidine dehydrogenase PreA subunit